MQSREYNVYDGVPNVTGLKRTDGVLLLGGNFAMPALSRYVWRIERARNSAHANKLVTAGLMFSRVFLARENHLDEAMVLRAARLTAPDGLICLFSEDADVRADFAAAVERSFPLADVWSLDSAVGPITATNASGVPRWAD